MKTIKDVMQLSAQYFAGRGIESPRRQSEELLSYVLGLKRIQLYMDYDRPLEELELEKCRSFLRRRTQGEPFAYIAGQVNFFDCKIQVNRNVLIPRQETEILLDLICKEINQTPVNQWQGKNVWDLCCGSGCLGIGLKKRCPFLNVTLSDISAEALAVAQHNAIENGVDVGFIHGDLLTPYQGMKANLVVCNPPYVSEEEYASLDPSVRNYEPKIALVGGPTGLEFYQRLCNELPPFLCSDAQVWFEIGYNQGNDIRTLFQSPPWREGKVMKDWSGHDRFFKVLHT
jgi:release factor glutamine methyltransferase